MMPNPIQFAVVREDPEIERAVLDGHSAPRVLMVASGGCTAFSLLAHWPESKITLVDPNPAQLDLVRRKIELLGREATAENLRAWNVDDHDPNGVCQCGNFEGLFRQLRGFLHEFVATPEEICEWFVARDPDRIRDVFEHRYWRVAFELHFSDVMLNAMFGPAATQHAPPASYPSYFRERLERGLLDPGAPENYFLHHIFLGRYLPDAMPAYLAADPASLRASADRLELVEGTFDDITDLASYDLVNLSNIMDWMAPEECQPMIRALRDRMRPGAQVLWRQLNNTRDRCTWFGPEFGFDHERDARLARIERSLFYESVHVGTKRK